MSCMGTRHGKKSGMGCESQVHVKSDVAMSERASERVQSAGGHCLHVTTTEGGGGRQGGRFARALLGPRWLVDAFLLPF